MITIRKWPDLEKLHLCVCYILKIMNFTNFCIWLFFRYSTHFYMSLFLSVCLSVRPSVAHRILGTVHHLIIIFGTRVKRYLHVFYFFFNFFDFFGLLGGQKGKKLPKMKNNNYIHHVPYLRNSIAYDHDFWYTCLEWWHLTMNRKTKKLLIKLNSYWLQ